MKYSIAAGELVISLDSDEIIFRGMVDGCPVSAVQLIPASDDCVVLLDYSARPTQYFENLLRLTSVCKIVWRAKYPADEHDFYVCVGWSDNELVAHTWNGYKVLLNPETGMTISSTFVK